MMRTKWILAAVIAVCALPVRAATLDVFAAASLRESFTEIGKRFEAAHPGDKVVFNFAGSNVLRTQIEQGAPADVFASADELTMNAMRDRSSVEKPVVFARNRLVVATSLESRVRTIHDLGKPGVRIVLAGPSVPAGRYAERALSAMDKSHDFSDGYRSRVMANVVSRETNVRATLSKVVLGEADAGFVYVTDAFTEKKKVKTVSIPARFNPTAVYPVAVVSSSRQKPLASAFVAFLQSREGKAILKARGFLP